MVVVSGAVGKDSGELETNFSLFVIIFFPPFFPHSAIWLLVFGEI